MIAGAVGYYAGRDARSTASLRATYQKFEFSSLDGDGTWVVSSDPGPNVPPVGRSLFDHLTMVDDGNGKKRQEIPFPFSKLMASIQGKLRPEAQTPGYGLKGVLIPLGRSLQRSASAPDFFRFPRTVIGVDGFPLQNGIGTGPFLRDRLFVGYNEKAAVLEIISYNEAAGRFEYQIAHDYNEGGKAKAVYANRSVCLSCHQNGTPIFSDQPWQETNAHKEVSSRILAAMAGAPPSAFDGQRYMGVPISVPEAQPQGIDNAKFRANLIPATHFLWQRLCESAGGSNEGSAKCRAQALALAIKMGFTNQLDETSPLFASSESGDFLSTLTAAWKKQWPSGLLISSPRIPNRNPLEKPRNPGPFDVGKLNPEVAGAIGDLIKRSNVPAEFEPLNKRAPLDRWVVGAKSANDFSGIANWLRQMVEFFTDLDWQKLDQWMSARAIAAGMRAQATGACNANSSATNKLSIVCEGFGAMDPIRLAGFITWDATGKAAGAIESLAIRTNGACDITQGAEQAACAEATNLVLRGQIKTLADGVLEATLASSNRINGQRTRFSDGNLLESIALRWKPGTQVAVAANTLRDFAFVEQALAQAALDSASGKSNVLAKRPFRRMAILAYLRGALGGPATDAGDCCEMDAGMPQAESESESSLTDEQLAQIVGPAAPFMKECSVCHRNTGGFPPNFLTGSVSEIQKQLSNCSERIWYRISMYDQPANSRGQSPMPPVARLHSIGVTEDQWRMGASSRNLRDAAATILKAKGITPPDPKTASYHTLPACFGNSF